VFVVGPPRRGPFVNRKADAVTEAVHVAFGHCLVGSARCVALALEHVAHQLLVAATRLAGAHLVIAASNASRHWP
jgi:hypothetical protein